MMLQRKINCSKTKKKVLFINRNNKSMIKRLLQTIFKKIKEISLCFNHKMIPQQSNKNSNNKYNLKF
jgi:hypothetical protein